jgi:hypothetical protein
MNAKHTPAPWGIYDGVNVMAGKGERSERCVASCGGHGSNFDETVHETNQANARLIAAAPELLYEHANAMKDLAAVKLCLLQLDREGALEILSRYGDIDFKDAPQFKSPAIEKAKEEHSNVQ